MKQNFLKCLFWNKFLVLIYKGIQQSIKRSAIKISLYWVQFIIVITTLSSIFRKFFISIVFFFFPQQFSVVVFFQSSLFPKQFCSITVLKHFLLQQFSAVVFEDISFVSVFFSFTNADSLQKSMERRRNNLDHQYQFQPLLLNINTMIGQLSWRVLSIPASLV